MRTKNQKTNLGRVEGGSWVNILENTFKFVSETMLEEDLECSEHWGEVLRTPWPSFLVSSGPRTHKQAHVPSGAHLHGRLTLPALPRTSPHTHELSNPK